METFSQVSWINERFSVSVITVASHPLVNFVSFDDNFCSFVYPEKRPTTQLYNTHHYRVPANQSKYGHFQFLTSSDVIVIHFSGSQFSHFTLSESVQYAYNEHWRQGVGWLGNQCVCPKYHWGYRMPGSKKQCKYLTSSHVYWAGV